MSNNKDGCDVSAMEKLTGLSDLMFVNCLNKEIFGKNPDEFEKLDNMGKLVLLVISLIKCHPCTGRKENINIAAMTNKMKNVCRKIDNDLTEEGKSSEFYVSYSSIDNKQVRISCKSLANKGFFECSENTRGILKNIKLSSINVIDEDDNNSLIFTASYNVSNIDI